MAGKVYPNFAAAVADIPDGVTIGFGGFAGVGVPLNLIRALAEQGAKHLVCVANSTGAGVYAPEGTPDVGMLAAKGQVTKVICTFSAPTRSSQKLAFTPAFEAGRVAAEVCPQGTLAERLRAAGAGIPAFYTPTSVGTELAAGKEHRSFGGREHVLEEALPLDYAFLRAWRADEFGNLQFRRTQRNFAPLMAMAARTVIAEVEEEILPEGAIDPDAVHAPGIVVQRLVRVPPPPQGLWPALPGRAGGDA